MIHLDDEHHVISGLFVLMQRQIQSQSKPNMQLVRLTVQ